MYRCLGEGHLGQYCSRTRVCGINNCIEVHHRLLHQDRSPYSTSQNKGVVPEKEELQLLSKDDVIENRGIVLQMKGS